MKYGIFYGTTSFITEDVSYKLSEKLDLAPVFNVADGVSEMEDFDVIFILTPTYGRGEIEENFEFVIDDILDMDLTGKKVAILGTGDIVGHSTSFVNTIKTMYDIFAKTNATLIGKFPTDGYDFEESTAVEGSMFLGLPIDEMNESDKTDERLDAWIKIIKEA